MIIFLYGPDSYHRRRKLREIIDRYRQKHSALTLEKFYLDDPAALEQLRDYLQTPSLFTVWKMAVVFDLFTGGDLPAAETLLQEYLSQPTTVVVLSAEKKPPRNFSFLLDQPVFSQEFPMLAGVAWRRFVADYIKTRQLPLSPTLLEALAARYQGDCWGLVNEVEKLALAPNYQLPRAPYAQNSALFDSIRELTRGNVSVRLPLLEQLLRNEDPAKIFNLLTVAAPAGRQCTFADYDVAVKSGKLEYEEVLLAAVIS